MLSKSETFSAAGLTIPRSIGFTPDKNRTWAQSTGLAPLLGHSAGKDTARKIIDECFRLGVRDVLFWAMSESNVLKRSSDERKHLVRLLKAELRRQEKTAKEDEGFYLCGNWQKAANDTELEDLVARVHERNTKGHYQTKRLTVLFGYRGITDFKQAASKVAEHFGVEGIENEDLIRSRMWISHLQTNKVDMLVRTGVTNENRHNSDSFLPLHGEQAYLYEVPEYWPAFTVEHLYQGIKNFSACHRPKGA